MPVTVARLPVAATPMKAPWCVHCQVQRTTTRSPSAITVDDVIAEGDRVVVRWTWQCTHQGAFMGVAATGKRATVTGMAIYRVADGKCVERWVELNMLGLLQQLRGVPTRAD